MSELVCYDLWIYLQFAHPDVARWLGRHPRFHLHFTPTSCSWLNLVERWFRNLTPQRLGRGSLYNVKELTSVIENYISGHNQNPRIFVWSASVERILAKVAKCKEALDAVHQGAARFPVLPVSWQRRGT